jgi:hypothetical protein
MRRGQAKPKKQREAEQRMDRARRERDRRRDAEVVELPELGPADVMVKVPPGGHDHGERRSERRPSSSSSTTEREALDGA